MEIICTVWFKQSSSGNRLFNLTHYPFLFLHQVFIAGLANTVH